MHLGHKADRPSQDFQPGIPAPPDTQALFAALQTHAIESELKRISKECFLGRDENPRRERCCVSSLIKSQMDQEEPEPRPRCLSHFFEACRIRKERSMVRGTDISLYAFGRSATAIGIDRIGNLPGFCSNLHGNHVGCSA